MIKLVLSTGEQLVVNDEGHKSVLHFINRDLKFRKFTVYTPGLVNDGLLDFYEKIVAVSHIVTAQRVYSVT